MILLNADSGSESCFSRCAHLANGANFVPWVRPQAEGIALQALALGSRGNFCSLGEAVGRGHCPPSACAWVTGAIFVPWVRPQAEGLPSKRLRLGYGGNFSSSRDSRRRKTWLTNGLVAFQAFMVIKKVFLALPVINGLKRLATSKKALKSLILKAFKIFRIPQVSTVYPLCV